MGPQEWELFRKQVELCQNAQEEASPGTPIFSDHDEGVATPTEPINSCVREFNQSFFNTAITSNGFGPFTMK